MERRYSTASDSSTDSRQSSSDGLEAGRSPKALAPKVAVNPLQFVKVGPCDLYRSAQEQLKKVEEIKKNKKEHKEEAEEWQSNLDSWKSSRRKRQEHIIERVVEVKKLELEEHERNRRRSKTFSEMMQERDARGRKSSLPVWKDEGEDFSDLGLHSKSEDIPDSDQNNEAIGNIENGDKEDSSINANSERRLSNGGEEKFSSSSCKSKNNNKESPKSSGDAEEYTYERAIQSYVNFAEMRVKSQSLKSIDEKDLKMGNPPVPAKPQRGSITKIDSFISQIELSKSKDDQLKKPIALPKVDVNKRKELFEKSNSVEDGCKSNKSADLPSSKSIKERLSSLEKLKDNTEISRSNVNVSVNNGVRERLSSIEKLSLSKSSPPRRAGETISSQSIKERLTSFEKSKLSPSKSQSIVEPTISVKERLSNLQSSCEKEPPAKSASPSADPAFREKSPSDVTESPPTYEDRAFSPEDDIYNKRDQHFRHRSLDSLDINQESMSNGSFERVQSLEDLDYRNYPASTFSGDTDREDSGIHTADVSSSVSQADDYDHLDSNILDDIKSNHQPPIEEETKLLKNDPVIEEQSKNVSDEESLMVKSLTPDSSLSESLPPILENPSRPVTSSPVEEPFVNKPLPTSPSFSSHTFKVSDNTADLPSSIESSSDNTLTNSNIEDNLGKIPESASDDIARDVCQKKNVDDSSHLVSLRASSISNKPEELCETPEDLSGLENEKIQNSNPVPNYENVIPSNAKNLTPQKCPPLQEVGLYTASQPLNDFPPFVKQNLDLNVPIVNQLTEMIMESEQSCLFPLSSAALEPPKEKPPPPPLDNSDEEIEKVTSKSKSIRRLDSTKRIKKELRQKRSSFLGLEGNDDDSYLEPELDLIRPPDMTTLLAEEKRLERQMYRQSVCSESDSNQESRDSGVELDHKHQEDMWSHSRNDSETFGNQSATSDEDEIMKKEREIIETLEQEEKIRKQDLGEKLAMRLRELEAEKERWELLQAESLRNAQNHTFPKHNHASAESLNKCRSQEQLDSDWCTPSSSLQDISHLEHQHQALDFRGDYRKSLGDLPTHKHQSNVRYAGHRRSMPNLQDSTMPSTGRRPPPPPPPVLPMKSPQLCLPQPPPLHHPAVVLPPPPQRLHSAQIVNPQAVCTNGNSGQMTRQTLHALSAAPRSRLMSGDSWQVQPKKKQPRPDAYNYQHWLIQEAEQRRITEQQERGATGRRLVGPDPQAQARQHHQQQQSAVAWPHQHQSQPWGPPAKGKHLPEAIIQTLTQRVQSRLSSDPSAIIRRRQEIPQPEIPYQMSQTDAAKDKMLSVSGKKRCSHCGDELGRGAAMIIESLKLFYHIDCFKCCVCCIQLGDGLNGTDVRVRNNKLHCHNCYSSDDGAKFSCV